MRWMVTDVCARSAFQAIRIGIGDRHSAQVANDSPKAITMESPFENFISMSRLLTTSNETNFSICLPRPLFNRAHQARVTLVLP
jgi:hypothetical protein